MVLCPAFLGHRPFQRVRPQAITFKESFVIMPLFFFPSVLLIHDNRVNTRKLEGLADFDREVARVNRLWLLPGVMKIHAAYN